MAASSDMEMLISGGKHVRAVVSRSPLVRPSTRGLHASGGALDTLQRSLYGLSTVAATYGSPGAVQKQAHRPPRLVHDTKVVEIPDRCEKIPLGLLEVRSRYSKGRAQAHCLL